MDGRRSVRVSAGNFGIIATGDNTTNIQTVLPPEALQPVASIAAPDRTVNLPPLPHRLVGRDGDLARLGRAPVEVVQGLAGIGKSALAAQHAKDQAGRSNPVWWINATSRADVELGLAALAGALQPGLATALSTSALADRATAWLAAHSGWLLVLDDVRALPDVGDLLRRVGATGGRVVVTSRTDLGWRRITPSVIALGPLSDDAARRLLARGGPVTGAAELCGALGNHPLALELVAAFLERVPLSPSVHRSLLATAGGATLSPVASAFRATLGQLDDNRLAGDILRIFAWYAEAIPFDLIERTIGQPQPAAEAIARLAAAGLVAVDKGRSTITVNPLLQSVVRDDRFLPKAVLCLSKVVPGSDEPDTWPQWRRLHPHIAALADRADPARDAPDLAGLLNVTGLYLIGQGAPATGLLRRARDAYLRAYGRGHADTLAAANNLALAHHGEGDLQVAIRLYEQTQDLTGPLEPVMVACANNLACAYEEAGRPGEAIRRLESIRDRWIAAHGDADRYSLILTTNLASAYRSNGDPGRAAALLRNLPSGAGSSRDAFHAVLESAKAELELDRPAAAVALLEPGLPGAVRLLGEAHPVGLDAAHTLGFAYVAAGRSADGIRLLESVLRRRTASLGPAHPDTLDTSHALGVALANSGALDRAIELLDAAATHAAATGHPDTALIRSDLEQLRRRAARS
ncbi:tetratricopeptide repeat protein [Actinoplanes sp. CA-142083]|uniref:tetratricopeptide repeat protein n=1 Tax=Actinoplanes sp. CA-142083 TaxID=3239903 RepID=UPI003D8A8718